LEEQREREKQEKKNRLKPEPEAGVDIAHITFRLPGGRKADRRFNKQDLVDDLYIYIDTLDLVTPYEIVTNFPLKVLNDRSSSLELEGFYPRAVVHVREL
jgi:hypothetical protein